MKIVIIQNTDKDFWPMFEVKNRHLSAIKKATSRVEISIIEDVDIGNKLNAEIILTSPFNRAFTKIITSLET